MTRGFVVQRFIRRLAVTAVLAAGLVAAATATAAPRPLPAGTRFFVPAPDSAAIQQEIQLVLRGKISSAVRLGALLAQGHAVWLNGGAPAATQKTVRQTMAAAALQHRVPVFVIYDVPFRDCGQYSSGGARSTAEYLAYVDAVAREIGTGTAVVIEEPDGLGLIPGEGCTPTAGDLAAAGLTLDQANTARYDQITGAVARLEQNPHVNVYLDATHPGWLNVGDATQRLLKAGVQAAQGFYLNASNYQYTADDVFYGTWISDCIALVTQLHDSAGNCPNQYWDGGPATNWDGDALDTYQVWRDAPYSGNHVDLKWNTTGIDSRWALMLGAVQPTTHFVVDTSRNGLGPWNWAAAGYANAGVAQDWCNPPGRGAGIAPTANTGNALVDAYLWIKTPGESDGSCTRDGSAGTADPQRGVVDPAAGAWFPQQALELASLASPSLLP
jgi:endoglucanase